MTAINISSDIATSFTTVSDIFIDQYMPKANGEFVKVYLYLLRATGSGAGIATISEIADHFSNTEADIIRALNYWASEGILQVQTGADGRLWESTSAVFLYPVCRLLRVIYKALWLIMPRRIICKTA